MEIKNIFTQLSQCGYNTDDWFRFKTENPKQFVEEVMRFALGDYTWLPEYDQIIDWMSDNKGKGLILIGKKGLGKTVFAKKVIPAFFLNYLNIIIKYYSVYEMNDKLDEILTKKFIVLDDVGNEDYKVEYGERRLAFNEIIDYCEQRNRLVVITSNLSPQDFEKKYGERTRDRIRACCHQVVIKGESLRR